MASESEKNAIVTLVTSEDFVIGAQVMIHSLLMSNPKIKEIDSIILSVMVTNNISDYSRSLLLSSGFDQIIQVNHIPNPNQNVHVSSWIDVGFTKLRIWSLIQFNKLLYIDADCIVINDILDLFIDNNIIFGASPDIFPPDNFNAGVLFIKPDINIFNILLYEMSFIESYDGGDTGFLNKCSLFKKWYNCDNHNDNNDHSGLKRLHFGFNAQRIMHWFTKNKPEYWISIENKLKIIHYSSSPKPWNIKPSQRMVDKLEMIWHKNWISLNEQMNKNQNKKIPLNNTNNIIIIDHDDDEKRQYQFDINYDSNFNKLMTKRPIQFGKIYENEKTVDIDPVKFEKEFLSHFAGKFDKFMSKLQQITDNDKNRNSDFIFDGIPKIIHQIWIGPNEIPKQYKLWSKSWNKYNSSNWKYMLWTDDTLKQNKFEWKSLVNKSLFEIAKNYGEKSDILRLEILYQFGGIYVDFDFECIQSLDIFDYESNNDISFILGFSNTGLLEINNAFIGSKPNHQILIKIWKSIQLICDKDKDNNNDIDTIIKTGPIQLTRCIMNNYYLFNDILIFPIKCFYPFPNNMRYLPINDRFIFYNNYTFAVHHWGCSWNDKLKNKITTNNNDNDNNNNSNGINIIDSIMNTSNNIALQSKIMSFLH